MTNDRDGDIEYMNEVFSLFRQAKDTIGRQAGRR